MGSHNFHPRNAVLLDGYYLIKKVVPEANLHDLDACEEILEAILSQVTLDPWPSLNRVEHPGFWLSFKDLTPVGKYSPVFELLNGEDLLYALDALLPSGRLVNSFRKVGLTTTFSEKGIAYAEFGDGTFVQLTPSLDTRFLVGYPKQQVKSAALKLANILQEKAEEEENLFNKDDLGEDRYDWV